MLDLCLRSRSLYPDWAAKLEALTGKSIGYWPCGILAPAYDQADLPHDRSNWRGAAQLEVLQPGLSASVVGGWWFADDAQVDNRLLMQALTLATQQSGVELRAGVSVQSIVTVADRVTHLATNQGDWQAEHYVLATGAWSQSFSQACLPLPVTPRKGQLLALRSGLVALQTVLFGSEIYIVPRRDGRIIVGATSEAVGFTPGNTAAGLQQLLSRAIRLMPGLADCEVLETWWGYRPITPDQLPILGASPYTNLTLATGHHRNGILLTPMTGQMIAGWVEGQMGGAKPEPIAADFHWSRFLDQS
jgi:glycine oxidase